MLRKKLHTPADLFLFKLGAAITMEKIVHDTLLELVGKASHSELKRLLGEHADETDVQIANLARAFGLLGTDPEEPPCPIAGALQQDVRHNLKRAEPALADELIAGAAGETEHHELAVYEELIVLAETMGEDDLADLLRQNLAQEERALSEVRRITRTIARETLRAPA